jgi:hypothetical protein
MKYRRLVAGVGLVGAGALALLAGPASAHQWNGNPAAPGSTLDETPPVGPDGKHVINMTLSDNDALAGGYVFSPHAANSVSKSRAPGCDSNGGSFAGGPCAVQHVRFNLDSPAFGGVANHGVTALMCNGKLAAPTEDGGSNSPTTACDFSNGRGLNSIGVVDSGTLTLDGSGNLPANPDSGQCTNDPGLACGDPGVQLNVTSCVTNGIGGGPFDGGLSGLGNASCSNGNPNVTCPTNPQVIKDGWTCIVTIAEFDPVALTPGDHVGFRTIQMKPPIPLQTEAAGGAVTAAPPLCNGVACPFNASPGVNAYGPIAPGVSVKITGSRFPCKTIQPDDPTTLGAQNTCLTAVSGKSVLVKRISNQTLEFQPNGATITNQTFFTDGRYTITFTMPNVLGVGANDAYRFVPHAPDCVFNQGASVTNPNYPNTCESPKLNASGIKMYQN